MYAHAHAPLVEETITLSSFLSGDELFAFIRGLYGLKRLPKLFTKQMYSFFQNLIDQSNALFLAHIKTHMFVLIEQLPIL